MPQVVQRDNTSLNRRDMETAFTCTCIWGNVPKRRAVVALTRSATYLGSELFTRPRTGHPTGARVALDVLRDDGRTRV